MKYTINISYQGPYPNGQEIIEIGDLERSVMTYSDEYYIAYIPELLVSATGSSYEEALQAVIDAVEEDTQSK